MVSKELNKDNKYLDFMGKVLSNDNLDQDLNKAKDLISKFDKYSSNLEIKDINQIENLTALDGLIDNYSGRKRREVEKVDGADVIYSDDNATIVSPLNHQASCYYGSGTKWCTAAQSDVHWQKYNKDAKLFYIINKKLPSSSPLRKIALLNKYDGEQTLYNALDEVIRGGWPGGPEQWSLYNSAIQEYLQDNFAREIKIFADEVLKKQELERINREERERLRQRMLAEAQERRESGVWNITNDTEESNMANAVFETVKTYFTVDDGEDIYFLYPQYDSFGLKGFTWLGEDGFESHFIVGDDYDANRAARQNMEDLIDDMGVENLFNQTFLENYYDDDAILDYYEDWIRQDVYDNPDAYLEDSERDLSEEQAEQVKMFEERIEKLMETQRRFEQSNPKWQSIQKSIEIFSEKMQEILDEPEGDFPEDKIEEAADERVEDIRGNALDYFRDMGIDNLEDFIDSQRLIKDAIESDGRGHNLSPYDGEEHDVTINGEDYFVYRVE